MDRLGGLLPLKNDFIFHKTFGDAECADGLRSFLASIGCLSKSELAELTVVDPQFLPDDPTGKRGTPDLVVRAASGSSAHLEMQIESMTGFDRRITFYASAGVTRLMSAGMAWSQMGRMISIGILNWKMTPGDESFHKLYRLREMRTGDIFTDALEIRILELPRVPRVGGGELENWLRFIRSEERDEMEALATKTPEMRQVYVKLQKLSKDENVRMIYEARTRQEHDVTTRLLDARNEGRAEGRNEGIAIGEKRGRAKGHAEGRNEGRSEGIAIGEKRGMFLAYVGLVRAGDMDTARAASLLGMSTDDFIAQMEQM